MKGTWQTSGSAGSTILALAVIVGAGVLAAEAARPVIDAVTELVRVALIAAAALAGTAAAAGISYAAWRWHHPRPAARPAPFASAEQLRAIQARTAPRQLPAAQVHHHVHLHGLTDQQLDRIAGRQHPTPED